jgi:hypothetical protein
MAVIAIIQNQHKLLNEPNANNLEGLSRQLYERFYEVLVDESGHEVLPAPDLSSFSDSYSQLPDLVICAPLPDSGNVAPGFVRLSEIKDHFPDIPLIVWSQRTEQAVATAIVEDYGVAHYYTGTLMDSADDFADLILKYT